MNFRPPAGPYRPNGPNNSSHNNAPRMQARNTLAPFDKRNAAYFVHDDMICDVDCVHNDDALMHETACEHADNLYANDDEFADCEFIIPLMLEDQETTGIRDTGNLGPVLVSKDFIAPERIIPGKYRVLQGAFDAERNKTHKLPMAKVNIRSPCFGYNKNIEIEAAVCKLPENISCVIGNSLFRRYPQLSDINGQTRHGLGHNDRTRSTYTRGKP